MNPETETPTIETPTHYKWVEVSNPTPAMLRECPIPNSYILAVHAAIKSGSGRDYRLVHNNVSSKIPRLLLETEKEFDIKDFLAVQRIIADATRGNSLGDITKHPYPRSELALPTPYNLGDIANAFDAYAPKFRESAITRLFALYVPMAFGDQAKTMWNGKVTLTEPLELDQTK